MEDVDKKNKPRLSVSDANTTPLLLTRSLQEVSKHMQERLNNSYKDFKLSGSSVDVLFTLLASNKPYSLSPGQLLKKMHITSGTLTTRIDKLEKKGLVKRESKKEDKRSVSVALTKKGLKLAEEVSAAHQHTQEKITSVFNTEEQTCLATLLQKYLQANNK